MSDILNLLDLYPIDYFGQSENENYSFPEDTHVVDFYFDTGNEVVEDVSLDCSNLYGFGADRYLVIADHPNALPDDAGVVGVQACVDDKPTGRLSMFVNDTAEDPDPPKVRDTTHGGKEYEAPRDTWLQNGRRYYGHFYQAIPNDNGMAMKYQCQKNSEEYEPLTPPTKSATKHLVIDGEAGTWYRDVVQD